MLGLVGLCAAVDALAGCGGGTGDKSATSAAAQNTSGELSAAIGEGVADQIALGSDVGIDYSGLRAVLVMVDGRTVFEKYYDTTPERSFNTWSITKSVMSTLVGIASARAPPGHPCEAAAEIRVVMQPRTAKTTLPRCWR